jgi:hypothetical protein
MVGSVGVVSFGIGTKLPIRAIRYQAAIEGNPDIAWTAQFRRD